MKYCARCGKPGTSTWNICADGNIKRRLCDACDAGVNTLVMRYVFGSGREADIRAYCEEHGVPVPSLQPVERNP